MDVLKVVETGRVSEETWLTVYLAHRTRWCLRSELLSKRECGACPATAITPATIRAVASPDGICAQAPQVGARCNGIHLILGAASLPLIYCPGDEVRTMPHRRPIRRPEDTDHIVRETHLPDPAFSQSDGNALIGALLPAALKRAGARLLGNCWKPDDRPPRASDRRDSARVFRARRVLQSFEGMSGNNSTELLARV
jgi:hypothetical protein